MYRIQIRTDDETEEALKKAVKKKKEEWYKYSMNDFIKEAIKEKTEREGIKCQQ